MKGNTMKNTKLLDFMAKACHYAQEHIGDSDAWSNDEEDREQYLQCVSYQMACFLAQNTVLGGDGVDWDIVLEELADNTKVKDGMMVKSEKEWEKIISNLVDELGGWL